MAVNQNDLFSPEVVFSFIGSVLDVVSGVFKITIFKWIHFFALLIHLQVSQLVLHSNNKNEAQLQEQLNTF